MTSIIIGYGVVGHNLKEELAKLQPDVYDKYLNIGTNEGFHDVAFICVPTPLKENGTLDMTEVFNAIYDNEADIYVIKSTVLVGTTDMLREVTGKNVVFSPEYYGGTQHCNNFDFPFTILGGERKDCIAVQQLLQNVYDARHVFYLTDSKTAEICKFMENSWLAYKVTFCTEFYKIAEKFGVDYEVLRECFLLDPRVNRAHTFVYREHPYYSSHCLDKDVPSIANQADSELLKMVVEYNEKKKKELTKGE